MNPGDDPRIQQRRREMLDLARADAEIAEAEAFHRPAALAACASLLRRFERKTAAPSEPDESGGS